MWIWLVGLVSVSGAAVAVVLAVRARRIAHHLALEMVQNRERLAALERAQREGVRRELQAEGKRERPRSEDARVPELLGRIAELERQTTLLLEEQEAWHAQADAAGAAPAAADAPVEVGDLVRRGLRQQGYRRVFVLDALPGGKVVVEAERAGTTAKGVAWVEPDGQVVLRSRSSHRAFP